MSGTERMIKDLSQLGVHLGVSPLPEPPQPRSQLEIFKELPVSEMVRCVGQYERVSDQATNLMRNIATRAALELDPAERAAMGIRQVVYVPMDTDGDVSLLDHSYYEVITVLPPKSSRRFFMTSRFFLQSAWEADLDSIDPSILFEIDSLVLSQAELRRERPYDKHKRLMSEIKKIDRLIGGQKEQAPDHRKHNSGKFSSADFLRTRSVSTATEELNDLKAGKIHEYLLTAQILEQLFPQLKPLYSYSRSDLTTHHIIFKMLEPSDVNFFLRLMNPHVSVSLRKNKNNRLHTTTLNMGVLKEKGEMFEIGSTDDQDRVAHEICEMLGFNRSITVI